MVEGGRETRATEGRGRSDGGGNRPVVPSAQVLRTRPVNSDARGGGGGWEGRGEEAARGPVIVPYRGRQGVHVTYLLGEEVLLGCLAYRRVRVVPLLPAATAAAAVYRRGSA